MISDARSVRVWYTVSRCPGNVSRFPPLISGTYYCLFRAHIIVCHPLKLATAPPQKKKKKIKTLLAPLSLQFPAPITLISIPPQTLQVTLCGCCIHKCLQSVLFLKLIYFCGFESDDSPRESAQLTQMF